MAGIEKFDGKDFGYWKMQIEEYLYQKKLHLPLNGQKPELMSEADWELLDREALSVVRSTLSKKVVNTVCCNEKTVAGLMTSLANIYDKPSPVKKLKACDCDFEKTKMLLVLGALTGPLVWSLSYLFFRIAKSVPVRK